MKKAKIMLLGIAIVGVVGGALAFKAQKYNAKLFCATTTIATAGNSDCPLNYRTDPAPTTTLFCTDAITQPCTITSAVVADGQ